MSYTHFTLSERKYLQELLSEEKSFREIAKILGRSPSTISREVRRNKAHFKPKKKIYNKYWYHAWRAEILYITRRKSKQIKLKEDTEMWQYIVDKLNAHWTPEQIYNRWNLEKGVTLCVTASTIYRYVENGILPNISKKNNLRRRGKNKNLVHHNCNVIHPDRIIPEWTDEIKNRLRVGDWEGDTVYGGIGKGLVLTLVDRKTRYLKMFLLKSRNATEVRQAITKALKNLPVHSISLDNGTEFAEFRQLETELNTLVYFAEPHKPWQRGTNENTNDIIRFYFPKGFDFRTVTQEDIQFVEDEINNRPRKCLHWKTPFEALFGQSVALA